MLPNAQQGSNPGWMDTGVVDMNGNPYWRGPRNADGTPKLSGGGGGASKLTLPDLRWNVALLNGLAVIFSGALAGVFLFLLGRIDDRFDRADEKIATLQTQVSDVRVAQVQQGADIKAILEKVDARKPTEGARPKPAK